MFITGWPGHVGCLVDERPRTNATVSFFVRPRQAQKGSVPIIARVAGNAKRNHYNAVGPMWELSERAPEHVLPIRPKGGRPLPTRERSLPVRATTRGGGDDRSTQCYTINERPLPTPATTTRGRRPKHKAARATSGPCQHQPLPAGDDDQRSTQGCTRWVGVAAVLAR